MKKGLFLKEEEAEGLDIAFADGGVEEKAYGSDSIIDTICQQANMTMEDLMYDC